MAIVFIKPIKGRLDNSLNYIVNPEKTANENFIDECLALEDCLNYFTDDVKTEKAFYVTGINCTPENAFEQMMKTKRAFHKTDKNLGYHLIQSFNIGEGTPELVHKIGVQLVDQLWGYDYEVVVATHLNTGILHNHIVLNSTSMLDGKKYYDNKENYKLIRKISDRLCSEHGLSVIKNPKQKSRKPYSVYMDEKCGISKDAIIKRDIDECIARSISSKGFYREMYALGYYFNFERKYPTISHPDFDRPRRLKTLGEDYTPEAITERVLANWMPEYTDIPEQDEPVKEYLYPAYNCELKVTYVAFINVVKTVRDRPEENRELQKFLYEECLKLDRLIEQQNLLCDNDIENDGDLFKFMDECEAEIKEVTEARRQLRNRLITAKRHGDTDQINELKSDISLFTERLKILRKDLKIANRIYKQTPDVYMKVNYLVRREQKKELYETKTRQNEDRQRSYRGYER